ncbi:MAG: hypothetical protein HYV63_21900 [Candidatus Schekmanbacteria bacterium]|nr:hypothetical protein [Candidatus Schekmanbacteria bacterium]
MNLHRVETKIFAADDTNFTQEELIPIFHRWIREKRLPETLLIDVADYRHVHGGPGVVLIAHELDIAMDAADEQLGMRLATKRDSLADAHTKVLANLRLALDVCCKLEEDTKNRLHFRGDRFQVRVLDRLVAPNTNETFAAARPALMEVFSRVLATSSVVVEHAAESRSPFTVLVSAATSPPMRELLGRCSA